MLKRMMMVVVFAVVFMNSYVLPQGSVTANLNYALDPSKSYVEGQNITVIDPSENIDSVDVKVAIYMNGIRVESDRVKYHPSYPGQGYNLTCQAPKDFYQFRVHAVSDKKINGVWYEIPNGDVWTDNVWPRYLETNATISGSSGNPNVTITNTSEACGDIMTKIKMEIRLQKKIGGVWTDVSGTLESDEYDPTGPHITDSVDNVVDACQAGEYRAKAFTRFEWNNGSYYKEITTYSSSFNRANSICE